MTVLLRDPRITWNVVDDVRQLFEFTFMVNAYRAGTIAAVTAAVLGWFMVLRRESFAGHTLALVGFPGAAGAVLVGASVQLGFFTFCIAGAVAIAALTVPGRRQLSGASAGIAVVQAIAIASGFLFASLYEGNLSGVNDLLFGTFLGITSTQVAVLGAVAVPTIVAVGCIARPLLFASLDPAVAQARGVHVTAVSTLYLVLLGAAAAEASQITGSLLIFALLVLPPAAAHALTSRPAAGVAISVAFGLGVTWAGLAAAYYSPYPIGFWITSFAFGLYVAARAARGARSAGGARAARRRIALT